MPLPLWFQTVELRSEFSPGDAAEKEGWFGSLKRRASLKRGNSLKRGRTGSIRRAKKEKDTTVLRKKDSFRAGGAAKKEKRE